uniref:Uncharacterized protein n=1 Tax=Pyrodinium bahamense TaxID=73915 RepID=A0A7S0B1X5_9DINO|mmetsp:Transcript_46837/g.130427  ORF Transcript_46837/g.130427 Transcript_46837/m.130427 type:complete len:307 (+) Transcript_46837:35-955(+)
MTAAAASSNCQERGSSATVAATAAVPHCCGDPPARVLEYCSEVVPRVGLAAFAIATVTIERMAQQVVNTSNNPKLPGMTAARALDIYRKTIPKQWVLMVMQFGGVREMKLGLDSLQVPAALSTMLACGVMGVPGSSLQYNWAIQDTYKSFGYQPPRHSTIAGFYRQQVAPGLPWAFARASLGTGSAVYLGPAATGRIDACVRGGEGLGPPGPLTKLLGGLVSGGACSVATQWIHNIALVAGRMAAMGDTTQAPYFTTAAMRVAWREFGPSVLYLNFPQRMVINAVTVAVLNACDIFGRTDLSPWQH